MPEKVNMGTNTNAPMYRPIKAIIFTIFSLKTAVYQGRGKMCWTATHTVYEENCCPNLDAASFKDRSATKDVLFRRLLQMRPSFPAP